MLSNGRKGSSKHREKGSPRAAFLCEMCFGHGMGAPHHRRRHGAGQGIHAAAPGRGQKLRLKEGKEWVNLRAVFCSFFRRKMGNVKREEVFKIKTFLFSISLYTEYKIFLQMLVHKILT